MIGKVKVDETIESEFEVTGPYIYLTLCNLNIFEFPLIFEHSVMSNISSHTVFHGERMCHKGALSGKAVMDGESLIGTY